MAHPARMMAMFVQMIPVMEQDFVSTLTTIIYAMTA
jgi:hypothetical protein